MASRVRALLNALNRCTETNGWAVEDDDDEDDGDDDDDDGDGDDDADKQEKTQDDNGDRTTAKLLWSLSELLQRAHASYSAASDTGSVGAGVVVGGAASADGELVSASSGGAAVLAAAAFGLQICQLAAGSRRRSADVLLQRGAVSNVASCADRAAAAAASSRDGTTTVPKRNMAVGSDLSRAEWWATHTRAAEALVAVWRSPDSTAAGVAATNTAPAAISGGVDKGRGFSSSSAGATTAPAAAVKRVLLELFRSMCQARPSESDLRAVSLLRSPALGRIHVVSFRQHVDGFAITKQKHRNGGVLRRPGTSMIACVAH